MTNNKTTSVSQSASAWWQITLLLVWTCVLHPYASSFVLECCFFYQIFIFFLLHFVNLFNSASADPFIFNCQSCLFCYFNFLQAANHPSFRKSGLDPCSFSAKFSIVYFLQSSILLQANLYLCSSCFNVTGILSKLHKKITKSEQLFEQNLQNFINPMCNSCVLYIVGKCKVTMLFCQSCDKAGPDLPCIVKTISKYLLYTWFQFIEQKCIH